MSPVNGGAPRDRLRIAIQKSGRLSEPARGLLASCGLSWRESRDKLFCYGETLPVDLLLVRDDDIPGLLADGVCDYGIVGRNVLDEVAADRALRGLPQVSKAVRGLGFGGCRLDIAIPDAVEWTGPASTASLVISVTAGLSWLAVSVAPLETRSQITSAWPRRGAISTEPDRLTIVASTPFASSHRWSSAG